MAGALDVVVRFVGDSSKLVEETKKVEGSGSKIKTWAKGIGAAIGAAFAVDQVRQWIGAASELQDQVGATGVVFGNAAKDVERFAGKAAEAFGLSKVEALDAANNVAAFGKGAGLSGKELAGFSTKLVGLAGDLASFRGTSPEQAIQAVGAALRGESEPIRAYGVLLDESTLKARAMSMGLLKASVDQEKVKSRQVAVTTAFVAYTKAVEKHGKGSTEAAVAGQKLELAQAKLKGALGGSVGQLTAQQKVLAANAEIFAQTKDAQGDFARTSDSAANQQKKLKAELANTQAALGTALLPVLQKILPYLGKIATFIEKNTGVLVPLAAALIALAIAFKIAGIAALLFETALGPTFLVVLAIIAGIAALIAIGYLIVRNWDTIKAAASAVWQFVQKAWDAILGAVRAVFEWIKGHWPLLLPILLGPFGLVVALIVRNFSTIQAAAGAVVGWFRSVWSTLSTIISAPFRIAFSVISGVISSIRSAISGAWSIVSDIVGRISGAVHGAFDGVQNMAGRIANVLKAPLNAVIRAWNRISISVPKVEVLGKTIFGGGSIGVPHIPELARGGAVLSTGLAVVHEGETFSGVGNTLGGGNTYNLSVRVEAGADPQRVGRTIVDYIRAFERANGNSWRTAS